MVLDLSLALWWFGRSLILVLRLIRCRQETARGGVPLSAFVSASLRNCRHGVDLNCGSNQSGNEVGVVVGEVYFLRFETRLARRYVTGD
jgi:hypothetical protein